MKMNHKKNVLSRILFTFIMLLFAMCLTMNVFFCLSHGVNPLQQEPVLRDVPGNDFYEFLSKAAAVETWTISESIAADEDRDKTVHFQSLSLNEDTSHTETISENISPIPMTAAIPKGFRLQPYLTIAFLYFFLLAFVVLPDGWTLMNQKVRLDN